MEPIVAGYVVTGWKFAGAFARGATIITLLGSARILVRGEGCILTCFIVLVIGP